MSHLFYHPAIFQFPLIACVAMLVFGFLDNPFKVENGCVTVSEKPGWGVEINPEWISTAEYQLSEIN